MFLVESLKKAANTTPAFAPADFVRHFDLFEIQHEWLLRRFEARPVWGGRELEVDVLLVRVPRTRPINLGVVAITDEPQNEGAEKST
ncbi:MAG TPA: hypothetical protein PKE16_17980 [Hyphomicrobium sp.]|nr:hypothetical protein [Hyphomicrobium sp.]